MVPRQVFSGCTGCQSPCFFNDKAELFVEGPFSSDSEVASPCDVTRYSRSSQRIQAKEACTDSWWGRKRHETPALHSGGHARAPARSGARTLPLNQEGRGRLALGSGDR